MLDPRIEKAFRNAAATLRDAEGNPPTKERVDRMLKKFKRLRNKGKPDDLAYIESIGSGWPSNAPAETE